VYAWFLRHRLPRVPVPLAAGDPDVSLDLQGVFTTVYDRAGYDYSLRYDELVQPPLREADVTWLRGILQGRRGS
jgi:hypothetical protein